MINVEQPCDDHFFGLQFPSEPDIYSDDMEFGYSQPYYNSWQENVNVMPGMKRTISNNSYPTDFAPGLTASNGSVHSGASSTVGSPYSAQFVPQDESYGLAQNSYSVPPAILNSEYGVNEMSGGDMSGMQYPHKTNGHFVGELDTPLSFKAQNTTSTFSLFGVDEAPRPNTSSPQSSRQPSPQRSHAAQAPVFKSPTAPASAYPKTPTHSTSPVRHPAHVFQNGPFQPNAFRQSPGSFMPAFGISCSFSLPPSMLFGACFIHSYTHSLLSESYTDCGFYRSLGHWLPITTDVSESRVQPCVSYGLPGRLTTPLQRSICSDDDRPTIHAAEPLYAHGPTSVICVTISRSIRTC